MYLIIYFIMQGGIKSHFFMNDSTKDWNPVSRTTGKHSIPLAYGPALWPSEEGHYRPEINL